MDDNQLGVAYGLSTAILNATLSVVPIIIGYIPSYFYKNLALMCIAVLGLCSSIVMIILDRVLLKAKLEFTCVKSSKSDLTQNHWRFLDLLAKIKKHKQMDAGNSSHHDESEEHTGCSADSSSPNEQSQPNK